MDKDKQIQELQRQIWWMEMQFKARESSLTYRIEQLEKQLDTSKNDFGDK